MDRQKLKAKRRAGETQRKKTAKSMDFDGKDGEVGEKSMQVEESKSEVSNQIQTQIPVELEQVEDESFIEKLALEMVMKIFEFLDVKSLVNCRLVSRKWNGLAREILQSRDDVETVFSFTKTRDGMLTIKGRTKKPEATLENFIKYFGASKESPLYTRFFFFNVGPSELEQADWIKFISGLGKTIKSLRLMITREGNGYIDLIGLVEKLRNLLLNQLPNLGELGLWIAPTPPNPQSGRIQLFPSKTVQLPHLKTIHLDKYLFSQYTGIAADLLRGAVNLQKIKTVNFDFEQTFENFLLLESLGKLGCLKTALIVLNADFMSKMKGKSAAPLTFKFKQLVLFANQIVKTEAVWRDASVFLSNLFESSKDSLTELQIDSVGFSPELQLPKFSKLTKLIIINMNGQGQVFPKGITNIGEIFPVLQFLEIRVPWTLFFPHDENENQDQDEKDQKGLLNLKSLKITGGKMTKEDIAGIGQVCRNLKELKIGIIRNDYCGYGGREIENFPEVGNAIWTRLTKLESLDLEINADSPANVFSALDSCFTGFSGEDSIRLYNLIRNEKAAEKQRPKIKSESKIQLDAERINPSILDLKGLKKLTVELVSNGWVQGKRNPDSILSKNILVVSEKNAFELMDGLQFTINRSRF